MNRREKLLWQSVKVAVEAGNARSAKEAAGKDFSAVAPNAAEQEIVPFAKAKVKPKRFKPRKTKITTAT